MADRSLVAVGLVMLGWSCAAGHGSSATPPAEPVADQAAVAEQAPLAGQQSVQVDFAAEVVPVLRAGCTPCHFEGGKMYAALPFDRAETVTRLGEALLTRIDEPDEHALIRSFLAQEAATEPRGADTEPW